MDTSNRRPQLPALNYLDIDRVKREEDAHQLRNVGTTAQSLAITASAAASPTYHYPPGPPPPYSHVHTAPSHATKWTSNSSAFSTPPDTRRTSEEEKENAKQPTRQSLPSILEALGVDSQTAFTPAIAPPPPPSQTHMSQSQSIAPASPSPKTRRAYPVEPSGPPTSFPGTDAYPQPSSYRTDSTSQPLYAPKSDVTRTPAAYPAMQESKPTVNLQTSQTLSRQSQSHAFPRPAEPSPHHDQPPSNPVGAMGPPSGFPYGYTPYPPRYANPTPPSSVSSGPMHQPSTAYGISQSTSVWKSEGGYRFDDRSASQDNYGDHVKRHLDFYDLETALNEISSASGILTDFARRYGDRMHHTQRSGASLSTLPGIVEVDDMISKSRVQLDSLLKIRDVILTEQTLYEQQVADQRNQAFSDPAQAASDQHSQEGEDKQTGGFAGVDSKKRRGRAAPPGRCHSCNRAETPEWRRGPDGARTLCNACGLHYAKLTRKKNGASSNVAVGGSNLRAKEIVPQ